MSSPTYADSFGAARPPGQPAARRFLTLLFSDLCGSTRLAASIEAEYYAEILQQLHETYYRVLPRHGGTVVRIQGDGMLAIFGHPEALETDGQRATEAALELHAEARALRTALTRPEAEKLRLHSGIHAGIVLVAQGDLVRGRFELMGNVPNIAARLSDVAAPDEILVSDETLGPERRLFVTGARRSLELQGISNPIVVLPILARAAIETSPKAHPQRELPPLIGRHAEMRRMEDALRQVREGRSAFLSIAASAGLGKTRLAEEFLRRCAAAGCRVHRGYCESSSAAKALQPFIHILRGLVDVAADAPTATVAGQVDALLASLPAELKRLRSPLLYAMGIEEAPAGGARRGRNPAEAIPASLNELFAEIARRQPQVLFIDDLHWADDATLRVLDSIRRAGNGILVLVTTRMAAAGDLTPRHSGTIALQPLSDAESMQHIAQLLPGGNPFLVEQIRQHSGGSPLFIEELCHCATEDAEVLRTDRLQRGAAWLNVLIESRVARLPEAQAALVRSASIIGNVMPAWLFASITGHDIDHPAVRQLAQLDLLFPGEQPQTLRFKHGIARDAIYDSVGLHQRKALHLRIAEALVQRTAVAPGEDHCEALAYHFEAAGWPDHAARYAEQAGDKAMAASALDRAQAQYRAALAALDRSETSDQLTSRWNAISQRLGLACVFNPSRSDLPLFQRALALAEARGDLPTIAQATYWLGYLQYALGDARQAVEQSERALTAARQAGDDRLAVQVRATLGQAMAAAGRYGPAAALLDEAIEIKRAHRSGTGQAVGLAYSLAAKGSLLGDRGHFADAMACFDEALEVVPGERHEVHASIHGLRAAVLLWQGRWEAARESAMEAFRIGEQVRSLFTLSMGRAAAAYAEWMIERRPEALDTLQHATRWLEPRGITLFRSYNHGWLADGYASCGNAAEARVHAAQAMRRWREQDLLGGAMACRAMARLAARDADGHGTERWLARARAIARRRDSAHEEAVNYLCEGEIALWQGRRPQANALLDTAGQAFTALGMSWHQAEAARLMNDGPRAAAATGASLGEPR